MCGKGHNPINHQGALFVTIFLQWPELYPCGQKEVSQNMQWAENFSNEEVCRRSSPLCSHQTWIRADVSEGLMRHHGSVDRLGSSGLNNWVLLKPCPFHKAHAHNSLKLTDSGGKQEAKTSICKKKRIYFSICKIVLYRRFITGLSS